MPVARGPEPTDNFTILSNDFLRDESLSYRARGVLAEILSHTSDWNPDAWEMSLRGKEGRGAIYTAFSELEAAGYLIREKRQKPGGQWVTRTTFYGTPQGNVPAGGTDYRKPVIGKPEVGEPEVGFPVTVLKTGTKKGTKEEPSSSRIPAPVADSVSDDANPAASGTLDLVGPQREDVERLCLRLADAIEANGSNRPDIKKSWRDAARLLLDKDGRTEKQVATAIDWCQNDEFWRSNILSMPTLRKQYDRLRLAAQRQRGNPVNGTPKSTTDERVKQGLDLAEKFRQRRLAQENAQMTLKEIEQ